MVEFVNKQMKDATQEELNDLSKLSMDVSNAVAAEIAKNKLSIESAFFVSTLANFIFIKNTLEVNKADTNHTKDIIQYFLQGISLNKNTSEEQNEESSNETEQSEEKQDEVVEDKVEDHPLKEIEIKDTEFEEVSPGVVTKESVAKVLKAKTTKSKSTKKKK